MDLSKRIVRNIAIDFEKELDLASLEYYKDYSQKMVETCLEIIERLKRNNNMLPESTLKTILISLLNRSISPFKYVHDDFVLDATLRDRYFRRYFPDRHNEIKASVKQIEKEVHFG